MTTIGKILVFLVFVAALAMGGMMVYVSKTTPSWVEAVKERDEKIGVFREMLKQENESRQKLVNENQTLKQQLDNNIIESKGTRGKLKLEIDNLAKQVESAAILQEKSGLIAKEALLEKERLQTELAMNLKALEDRQTAIVKLQADLAFARTAEQAAKNDTLTATTRAASLLERNRELERSLTDMKQLKSPASAVAAGGAKDASYRNPPPVYIKGRIERVDDNLVKITVGSDAGLRNDQTLEVYRLEPQAAYLGRLVIVDANLHYSIARLLTQRGTPAPTLRPGDEVASSLQK